MGENVSLKWPRFVGAYYFLFGVTTMEYFGEERLLF
jgi:hypothetical protein